MGYFDALTSGSFKTTESGQKLFFPWGPLGSGYVVPSAEQVQLLRGRLKIYYVVTLIVTIVAVELGGPFGGAVALPILLVPYVFWVRVQCRGLARTAAKLTYTETILGQVRGQSALRLWALELGSLLFVSAGLLILVEDLAKWRVTLPAVAFFALCALMFGGMLLIKRRENGTKRP